MQEYHKIQSVFERDPDNKFRTFIMGRFALPEFELLRDCTWRFTEKVDGTNIRVHWDGESVRFGGRTDNASIPAFLLDVLMERFPAEMMLSVFGDRGGVTLYGEGCGAKIQKGGGDYYPDRQDFILFDIAGGDTWFDSGAVVDFADKLGVRHAECIAIGSLDDAVRLTADGFPSSIGKKNPAEGLVCRPALELRDRLGKRIITKLKHKDFRRDFESRP